MKDNAIPNKTSNIYKIGQYWGEMIPNESLYNKIIKKYSYKEETDTSITVAVVESLSKIEIEAYPGTVFKILENGENDWNFHIINETGLLSFNEFNVNTGEPITSIKDIQLVGMQLRRRDDSTNIINSPEEEWFETLEIYNNFS